MERQIKNAILCCMLLASGCVSAFRDNVGISFKGETMVNLSEKRVVGTWFVEPFFDPGANQRKNRAPWKYCFKSIVGDKKFADFETLDDRVIDYQIDIVSRAGVDFLIIDITNCLHTDKTVYERVTSTVRRIKLWNDNKSHNKLKYAIAIGCINYTHDPLTVEKEASEIYNTFVKPEIGSDGSYLFINDRPLLVVYTWYAMRKQWENLSTDKTDGTDKFTVRFAEGNADHPDYYGWSLKSGAIPSKEVMFVTPRKPSGKPQEGRDVNFYKNSWELAIKTSPKIVIAGAFGGVSESNGIGPSDTSTCPSQLQFRNDKGQLDPYLYWDITKSYIEKFKH